MNNPPADDSFAMFAARLRAAGFTVADTAAREMWEALPGLDALREGVRSAYRSADEPAHVFDPARQGESAERKP
ncbi:MAG: hypothetical protein HOI95_21830 [Chromatiales bacterium]|jgi:uncharacterized protein with von Willebrand factor type A (vWA) domain|nr:hypothetical protein [Chromatiales bacterium]